MAHTVRKVTAVSAQVDDRIGVLAELANALRDANLNMRAVVSQRKAGTVLMGVPDDLAAARSLAAYNGIVVQEREVLLIEGDDEVGALCPIANKLASARINIEDVYALATEGKYAAVLTFAAEDVGRAAEVLGAQ